MKYPHPELWIKGSGDHRTIAFVWKHGDWWYSLEVEAFRGKGTPLPEASLHGYPKWPLTEWRPAAVDDHIPHNWMCEAVARMIEWAADCAGARADECLSWYAPPELEAACREPYPDVSSPTGVLIRNLRDRFSGPQSDEAAMEAAHNYACEQP